MDEIEISYIEYVKRVQSGYRNEQDFYALSELMDVEIAPGKDNCLFYGPPPVITIQYDLYMSRHSHTLGMHELAHHLMEVGGFETKILRYFGSYDDALPEIERLCYHAALVLQMPDPLLKQALRLYGQTPAAILYLTQHSSATFWQAACRWVYSEVGSRRAAFIACGNYITEVATTGNFWLPFWLYDRVVQLDQVLPEAKLIKLSSKKTFGTLVF